ncbi:MAG: hypothetical protein NC337_02815 [Roseburia sp.]|nr:hypothetical protein [Roseburia sp.]
MKDKMWVTLLLFALTGCLAVAIRVYDIRDGAVEILIRDDLLNRARIGEAGFVPSGFFAEGISVEALYLCLLSGACLLFGNFAIAGVWLNALLQTGTVLAVFVVVKWLSNRYVSGVAGVLLAAMPLYLHYMYELSPWNLEILLCAVGLLAPSWATGRLFRAVRGKRRLGMMEVEANSVMESEIKPEETLREEKPEKKIKFIENPLPVPKRKPHKEMDYAIQTAENDDYDIQDMADKDFFDID